MWQIDSDKLSVHKDEKARLDHLKKLSGISETPIQRPKKRKVKGVNPLAMKKKKSKVNQPVAGKHSSEPSKVISLISTFFVLMYANAITMKLDVVF